MASVCSRLQSIPRWIVTLFVGILIGWATYALNVSLYEDTVSDTIIIPRTQSMSFELYPYMSYSNLSNTHYPRAQLLPKYQPMGKFDLQSWQYFDKTAVFSDVYVSMVYWRHAAHNMNAELESAVNFATVLVSRELGKKVRMADLSSGYVRHNPTRGYEYIIDAKYISSCRNCIAKPFSRRVSFVRPLAEPIAVPDVASSHQIVSVVVPISNVNQRFTEFMENFERAFLRGKDAVHLVFVVYQDDTVELEDTLKHYRSKHKSAKITLLKGEGRFSRGRALHYGISSLGDNDLVFICDVDITIDHAFMDRCRKNTIQGERVFYPVVFKQYNSKYTSTKNLKPGKSSINRRNGHWFYYSYGMLCIYKSDYITVGGLDIEIEGWGLEDVMLYEAIVKANLEVLKVPDPALTHRWHESRCPDTLTDKQHSDCLGSLYEGIADKKELAQYIYEHGYQIQT